VQQQGGILPSNFVAALIVMVGGTKALSVIEISIVLP